MYDKLLGAASVALFTLAMLAPARADGPTMYALVAANATEPFNELIAGFEKSHPGVTFEPNYTGTQILEQQLENGAPCDVFLSVDLPHAVKLHSEGLIERNYLVSRLHEIIVVPKSDPAKIDALRDLARPGVKLIIGVPDVPIGIYTRTIFQKADGLYGAGFDKEALANVVSFEVNVKQVLQKVVLNEADAGIVYRTDVDPRAAKRCGSSRFRRSSTFPHATTFRSRPTRRTVRSRGRSSPMRSRRPDKRSFTATGTTGNERTAAHARRSHELQRMSCVCGRVQGRTSAGSRHATATSAVRRAGRFPRGHAHVHSDALSALRRRTVHRGVSGGCDRARAGRRGTHRPSRLRVLGSVR